MARAANAATATTTASNVLTGTCKQVWVQCDASSLVSVNFRIQNTKGESIHGDSEFFTLAAGEGMLFNASQDNFISNVTPFTASGSGTYSFTVTGN